jgi:hypothetical protein
MSAAKLLRRAAKVMRERVAEATTDLAGSSEPWCAEYAYAAWRHVERNCDIECQEHPDGDLEGHCHRPPRHAGYYLASWHPAVALAVADWLDTTARDVGTSSLAYHAAVAVARAYLGETS